MTMSKKIVIKADLIGNKRKSEILAIVSKNQGIKSMEIDAERCTLTVVGTVDPVRIVQKLKKKRFEATIVSVEKEDPCKEACEKLCKEKCDKMAGCEECKDKCEKACNEWLGKGCRCDQCKPSASAAAAGCYGYEYDPCAAVPSYYPYGGGRPYPYYVCYEERSPEGTCTIQ